MELVWETVNKEHSMKRLRVNMIYDLTSLEIKHIFIFNVNKIRGANKLI